jgi:hypothetical protein
VAANPRWTLDTCHKLRPTGIGTDDLRTFTAANLHWQNAHYVAQLTCAANLTWSLYLMFHHTLHSGYHHGTTDQYNQPNAIVISHIAANLHWPSLKRYFNTFEKRPTSIRTYHDFFTSID